MSRDPGPNPLSLMSDLDCHLLVFYRSAGCIRRQFPVPSAAIRDLNDIADYLLSLPWELRRESHVPTRETGEPENSREHPRADLDRSHEWINEVGRVLRTDLRVLASIESRIALVPDTLVFKLGEHLRGRIPTSVAH